MKISKDKVVTFHYALVNAEGEVLDGSRGAEPLPYLHGHNNIVPGLERAMDGHVVGDKFKVNVSPSEGYGLRDEDKVSLVERASFADFAALDVGMMYQMEDENGDTQLVSITQIDDNDVTVDANHPFAGLELNFDVEIMDIREATEDELSAGRIEL
ncbi:peptidylprolyl isomerase [Neptuniibacter pectenicola]|jgi:FKBP-type peptidyl-prolyl cis-trans isomerase SlyD|uniref:Peptidyl-prolyl cis-trans isomerase n=1 Tax=Neptuniibacter pectenicola TaxID=1806669 RepID=A0ABU9TUK0_9GAMM|nr:peptidylprolyl isomerase [Neptuniibacter pectenicola]KXJ54181.1 MAG: peptidylprolyl isomerase [Neptuniibacter sp. Phe_28]|tara:strand:- start:578 stop:1045 length:468 start_codon:yes stop_codon:yes gene_type:complete